MVPLCIYQVFTVKTANTWSIFKHTKECCPTPAGIHSLSIICTFLTFSLYYGAGKEALGAEECSYFLSFCFIS